MKNLNSGGNKSGKVNKNKRPGRKISGIQFMKELEELEPKNLVDYVFRGSALNQWMKREKII